MKNTYTDKAGQTLAIVFTVVFVLWFMTFVVSCSGPTGDRGPMGPAIPVVAQPPVSITTAPATLLECPTGGTDIDLGGHLVTVCNGAKGASGGQGAIGQTGDQGVAGTPGTVITPVQFCSGFTPSYPSTFAESGICIDNQMYGVYSLNGGFLALLPPGSYSSDGVNSSCNFTILPNCGIQ